MNGAFFGSPRAIFFVVVLFAGAAIMEELAFRGYTIKVMDEQWSRPGAVFVTSVLFGLVHIANPSVNPAGVINIFLSGLLLALVYLKTGSLWAAIGLHFGWNLAEGPLLGTAVSGLADFPTLIDNAVAGPGIVSGGAFGIEGSIIATAVLAAAVILLLFDRFPLVKPGAGAPTTAAEIDTNDGDGYAVFSEEKA